MHIVDVLTKEVLARALEAKLGMPSMEADERSEFLLDIFGFDEQVIDNVLEPEDRQFFYNLQGKGLLSTKSEETDLHTGHAWRTHYWLLRNDRINAAAQLATRVTAALGGESDAPDADVYGPLSIDLWKQHAAH